MEKPFNSTKPVQTRNGSNARIICINRKSDKFKIVALVEDTTTEEAIHTYCLDGSYSDSDIEHPLDLINIPEKHSAWFNFFRSEVGVLYSNGPFSSKEEAYYNKAYSNSCWVTTTEITWEE